VLPNLIIIGAGRCGTSSLHNYLDAHPDIAMSKPKELDLFTRDDWREQLAWYESHFQQPATIRGESSPTYTWHPLRAEVPERIAAALPDVRFVYLVGDPIRRISSQWVLMRSFNEKASLDDAVRDPGRPDNEFVAPSRYATQLERYLEVFPAERIRVVDQDDLRSKRAETLRGIFGFLGVDPDVPLDGVEREYNAGADKRRMTPARFWVWNSVIRRVVLRLPARYHRPAERRLLPVFSKAIEKPVLSDDRRAQLAAVLGAEADRLRELTGQPFAGWSV
jgi:hypothetical protein